MADLNVTTSYAMHCPLFGKKLWHWARGHALKASMWALLWAGVGARPSCKQQQKRTQSVTLTCVCNMANSSDTITTPCLTRLPLNCGAPKRRLARQLWRMKSAWCVR